MKIVIACLLVVLLVAFGCNNNPEPKATMPEQTNTAAIDGEQLFKVKCAQCHMPAKDFAAPALAGVESRWPDKSLLYAFVKNSNEVIQTNDYAARLFAKWNQSPMLPFPQLTNEDIDAILTYCNDYASKN